MVSQDSGIAVAMSNATIILHCNLCSSTYDHRSKKAKDPVRSPIYKLRTGLVVVRWVTTCEFKLSYVFVAVFFARRRVVWYGI